MPRRTLLLFLALAACVGREPVIVEDAPEAAVCRRGPECDEKWRRALEWVMAHSRWKVREATDSLIATEGPLDTLYLAFTVRRLRSSDTATETIVFEAGCSPERAAAVVDHVPTHGPRWANVSSPKAKHTECIPPVGELAARFVRFVNASGR